MEKIRIQKFLSDCGIVSRRRAEADILENKVTVNGKPAQIGQKIDPDSDIVTYDGRLVRQKATKKIYLKLNKPRGYVSTMSDERGRKCVADLVADAPSRVYPVGRLDLDSEGLLLLTNDGELANRIMHPKNGIEKVYHVKVRTAPDTETLAKLNLPMEIDGYTIKPCRVSVPDAEMPSKLLFVLCEGRNRQIRKMCDKVGLEVTRLKRISEGKIKLNGLRSGKWEMLTPEEVSYLKSV